MPSALPSMLPQAHLCVLHAAAWARPACAGFPSSSCAVGPDGLRYEIFKLWRGRVDFGRKTVSQIPPAPARAVIKR